MESNALEGLRVLDLSRNTAGAYATLLMAGFGADVILVEPPEGHPFRHRGPYAGEKPDAEKSVPFLWYGQGKKSVTIDLDSETGREKLRRRIADADIVVESFAPGRLEMKLGRGALCETHPHLIHISITPFGQTGPYRDFEAEEFTIEALSGQMYGTGSADHPPLCSGVPIAQMTAGLHAYIAALTAIKMRDGDGRPRHIDVSIHEAGVYNMELRAFPSWRAGKNPTRQEMAIPAVVPWKAYRCRDGWAAIHGAPFRRWRYFARLFRLGRILEFFYAGGIRKLEQGDAAAAGSLGGKRVNRLKRMFLDHLDHRVRRWAAGKTREEILNVAKKNTLAFGALRTLPEILVLPQHKARKFFRKIDHPAAGTHPYCGAPFPMSRTPWRSRPAPLLGEHNGETDWMPRKRPGGEEPARGPLPLSGLRVIDLTVVEAAPHGTRLLADFGAEMIKVEYAARLDVFRGTALGNRAYDRQPLWAQLNRNKRSVTLDLKSKAGKAAFRLLVERSDAVVANFRDGTLERLGLDYDRLKEMNSRIILVSMPAYGIGGPDSDLPSFGGVIEVMSGVQNLTAYPGGKTERIRELDILNGVAGAAAVLTALRHRDRTGEGQQVQLSQAETTTHALMGETLLELAANGAVPPPAGNRDSHGSTFQGCYPCREEDRWLTICLRNDDEWRTFCDAIGRQDWMEDPRFDSQENRFRHHDSLDEGISEWTRRQDSSEAMMHLQNAGIAAGAVHDLQGVVDDPHLRERGWFFGSPKNPESFFMGYPFAISGIEPGPPRPGPALGEGNEEILGKWLGIPEDDRPEPKQKEIRSAFHLDPYQPPD